MFWTVLNYLDSYLWHLTYQQEKLGKNESIMSNNIFVFEKLYLTTEFLLFHSIISILFSIIISGIDANKTIVISYFLFIMNFLF